MHRLKTLLSITLLLMVVAPAAYGQLLSDRTGFAYRLDIEAGGHAFEVETASNFDIRDYSLDRDQKRLTLHIFSSLEDNLGEVVIPRGLLGGNFTVHLNDREIHPDIRSNEKISFITLNFTGSGDNRVDIFGSTYLGRAQAPEAREPAPEGDGDGGGACLIATAAYGSELAPRVQELRETRDGKVMATALGAAFVDGFSQVYYLFSPHVADYQRENPAFKEAVRLAVTPLVASLGIMSMANSEQEVLGLGIAAVLVNAGMYFAAPAVVLALLKGWWQRGRRQGGMLATR